MKKYIVSLGYYYYVFNDRDTALNFAETALDASEKLDKVEIAIENDNAEVLADE